ncbi:protein transport protein sec31-like [Dorcoceras hygrometricum]|uniref:Protein transport protein sec31-like n=1 Tax=Dorcoceras hygrometricum TaxID=472368 RepID=A0A2Z7AJH2_9LAMI|nr:protein transport protein sec31-like [Dorcoceras hygrometricum]
MASSYYTNTLHVNFESVLAMDDLGMVPMFQALMASGLEGFLGCPAVIYEAALVDFFENASVRDGMVVSIVHGVTVEISEQLFAETFEIPVEVLSELSEIPKDLLFDARSIVSLSCEPILTDKTIHRYIVLNEKIGVEEAADAPKVKKAPKKQAASKKRPVAAAAVGEPVLKKKRTMKNKSGSSQENVEMVAVAMEAVPIQIIAPIPDAPAEETIMEDEGTSVEKQPAVEVAAATGEQEPAVEHMDEQMAEPTADVETIVEEFDEPAVEGTAEEIRPPSTDDVDNIIEQVLAETAHIEADEEDQDIVASNVGDKPTETADGKKHWFDLSYEDLMAQMDAERPVPVEDTETEADELSADEAMSLEYILLTIPVDVPLPSANMEITKITLGQCIKILGVDERTWYLANLPKIKPEDKGKKPLEEKDPVKGHPVKEQILLILADIECLVQLRENIIDDVDIFFNLFIFKKLASLKVEDISAKEELVLSWGEAESIRVALNRRIYILTKYRELLIRKFLEARKIIFAPGDGGDNVRSTYIVYRFSGSMSREGQKRGRSGGRSSSSNRSGSSKRRHYCSSGGPFRRSFEDWLG